MTILRTCDILQSTTSPNETGRHVLDDGLHVAALTCQVDDGAVMLCCCGLDALHGAGWEFVLEGQDSSEVYFGASSGCEEEKVEKMHCEMFVGTFGS